MKRFGLNSGYIGVDRRRDEAGIAPLQKVYLERIRGGNYSPQSTLLLDLYPNAAVAYSLRKLRTSYSGSAIRVRRSSDNTEQDIGFDANNELDTTALTTFCGAGNGFISRWYDQSGNNRNVIQTTALNQPQIVNSGSIITENGDPFVSYTGINKQLKTTSSFSISSPLQVFFVAKNTRAVSDFPYYFDFQTNRAICYYANDVIPAGLSIANGTQINSGDTSLSLALFNTLFNGASSSIHKNGSLLISGNAGSNGASGILFLGTRNNNIQNITGGFQEFILYPSDQSSNRIGIENNITTYYGIP